MTSILLFSLNVQHPLGLLLSLSFTVINVLPFKYSFVNFKSSEPVPESPSEASAASYVLKNLPSRLAN